MSIAEDLQKDVARVFKESWDVQHAKSVPETEDLVLSSNHAKELGDCTVLYADLAASTLLVDTYKWSFSAEIYKSYLHCAASLIRLNGGDVTAYDGDRVMAIYIGGGKNTAATRTALNIQWAVTQVINPALKRQYKNAEYSLSSVIGIDSSVLRATRTGVRKDNDLVWVGSSANHAAKLSSLPDDYSINISEGVFDAINSSMKTHLNSSKSIWYQDRASSFGNQAIYRTTYWRRPNE